MPDDAEAQAPGADALLLDPRRAPARGLTSWLAQQLRAAIGDGRLADGAALPATRTLAAELQISRGVVVEAYAQLAEEGLVDGRAGAGTVVIGRRGRATTDRPSDGLRPGWHWTPAGPLGRPSAAAAGRPVDLDLSPGLPDLSAFPRAAWLRAERQVWREATPAELGYGDPAGSPVLRTELSRRLSRTRGLDVDPARLIVVGGVAQALALLAQVLRARGRRDIAVEEPGSRGARDQLASWGLRPLPVPVDEEGLDVAALARTEARTVLVTPAHQFPSGVLLSAARRAALLDWVADDGLVIEDDYDAEHRYGRPPVAALQPGRPDAVAYTGSTSKTLAPAMRLGWLVPPPALHGELVERKQDSDLGSPALPQLVLAQLLATGELDRHLRAVRTRQRRRRDALAAGLAEHVPQGRIQGIAAGLQLLVTLPDAAPGADLAIAERALADGMLVHPLSWHRQQPGVPGLVLGYAANPPDRLHEAARRLGRILR
jgi:GntR family transcriptional regulator/MocR family aminotransferase